MTAESLWRDLEASADEVARLLDNEDPALALAACSRPCKGPRELALLLSRGADAVLEDLAKVAHEITLRRFGRILQLYIPLYVSNRCRGTCPYCGFRGDKTISRERLSIESVVEEGRAIAGMSMRHILLVSGDDPQGVDVAYLAEATRRLKEFMHSVSIEVPTMTAEDYRELAAAGLDGVTLYQESYDREIYASMHAKGPKSDFLDRLDALERAGKAGVNVLTAGALWGLAPWRTEALRLGIHAAVLQKRCWKSFVQAGLPRLRQVPESFEIPAPITDRDLAHIIVALRIYQEEMGLVLSTRESPELRDGLLPLGITQMSAGSSTRPGGYSEKHDSGDQFPVVDERSPLEVSRALKEKGYDPVWKDWDKGFLGD